MTFAFGLLLLWFGLDAALSVPGQFWELGGLPKRAPMMVLPICGALLALTVAINLTEDLLGWHLTTGPAAPMLGDAPGL
jgi:TRAP-type C4-dicarboxylate transport system permease small subunit